MKKSFAIIPFALAILLLISGCAGPGGETTFADYTGKAPNGALGTIKLLADHPDHKGVEVSLTLSGFGDVPNVSDQKDAQKASEALVKYASLYNEDSGFTGEQYYYVYNTDSFKAGSTCKVTLYYLVPPEAANENLHFKYDYPDKKILIDQPCLLF